MATFLEPYAKLGGQLNSAVNAYNQGVGSLDARVLQQLRRIEAAGAGSEKPLASLTALDTPAKLVVAPDAEQAASDEVPRPRPPESASAGERVSSPSGSACASSRAPGRASGW
jgi:DNA anti-recombination protein RmuC